MTVTKFGIGQPMRRVEDRRLLTGGGNYGDDYAPAGCLRGTVRGALALSAACLTPTDAVALALTPRANRGPVRAGLGWLRAPAARGVEMWWHNGGTHGSRAFTGFVPESRTAVAAATNSPASPDRVAAKALAQPSS